jgi:septal ring factor EnvC (AmiA/AmiB activator)
MLWTDEPERRLTDDELMELETDLDSVQGQAEDAPKTRADLRRERELARLLSAIQPTTHAMIQMNVEARFKMHDRIAKKARALLAEIRQLRRGASPDADAIPPDERAL